MVCYRSDNNTDGKAKWSVASRVRGHEGDRDVWVLCKNVRVYNLRPANDAEALAQSILNGNPIIVPSDIISDGQKFIDTRSLRRVEAPLYKKIRNTNLQLKKWKKDERKKRTSLFPAWILPLFHHQNRQHQLWADLWPWE